jgi:ADP-ribose pyrophosphatase YjhB (NUDIX family)
MRVLCAGAVVRRDDGRILVVQRARPPSQGRWSIPGGRVEPGEGLAAAARREVVEATGLDVVVGAPLGRALLPGLDEADYDVTDFAARAVGDPDTAVAGDDAAAVRWVSEAELTLLDTSPHLAQTLASWGVWDA